jgi:flagellar motor protein MotB
MRVDFGRRWVLLGAMAALVLAPGCASRRNIAKERMTVVEAEAIDARQRAQVAEQEVQVAVTRADQVEAEKQALAAEKTRLERQTIALSAEAARGREAQEALAYQAEAARRQAAQMDQLEVQISNLNQMVDEYRKQFAASNAPTNKPLQPVVPAENVEAFRRDLESRLRAQGISLPVETRTLKTGEQQVAVVLRGAFPSGKHSLAHNMEAVKAVVWLGELISRDYPGSRIRVEGHTDGDPIRKSNYRDNYHLSEERANSVRQLLVKAGVSSSIETVGMGHSEPLESENTKRGKEMNRRVEIYIQPAA